MKKSTIHDFVEEYTENKNNPIILEIRRESQTNPLIYVKNITRDRRQLTISQHPPSQPSVDIIKYDFKNLGDDYEFIKPEQISPVHLTVETLIRFKEEEPGVRLTIRKGELEFTPVGYFHNLKREEARYIELALLQKNQRIPQTRTIRRKSGITLDSIIPHLVNDLSIERIVSKKF